MNNPRGSKLKVIRVKTLMGVICCAENTQIMHLWDS